MNIGGKYDPADVLPRHWQMMCKDARYSYPAMRRLLLHWAERLPIEAQGLNSELQAEGQFRTSIIWDRIVHFIGQSCGVLERRIRTEPIKQDEAQEPPPD
jgi:hypothetical protein